MMITRFLLAGTAMLLSYSAIAQDGGDHLQMPKLLMPPPNAYQITKGADVNVGLNTGTANLSIPIFEIPIGGQKLSYNLNYSSNGVLVDEVASRTGINWSLNLGGVITRTVMDEDDEFFPLLPPPAGTDESSLASYVYNMIPNGTDSYNTQPDEYSFNVNGLSGKFFYDHNGNVRLNTFCHIQVQKSTAGGSSWKFMLTDDKGTKYYFGGSSATEKSKYTNSGCARNYYAVYSDVSYYLTKIEFTNGESLSFNYENLTYTYPLNVSQTINVFDHYIHDDPPGGGFEGSTPFGSLGTGGGITTCQNIVTTQGKMLASVVGSNGVTIDLENVTREDVTGEKLVQAATLKYNGIQRNKIVFGYVYSNSNGSYEDAYTPSDPTAINYQRKRLFLTSVSEYGALNTNIPQVTSIEYNDLYNLPPRLSTAQDHFGYFNGRHNNYYVPKLNSYYDGTDFNTEVVGSAIIAKLNAPLTQTNTSDRSPDFNYCKKGSLKKIIYKTGGYTELEWEQNSVYKQVITTPPPQNFSNTVVSNCVAPSFCPVSTYNDFTLSFVQPIQFNISTTGSGEDHHTTGSFEVIDLSSNQVLYSTTLFVGTPVNYTYYLQPGTYRAKITSNTSSITVSQNFNCIIGSQTTQSKNLAAPGLRVKKIINSMAADPNQPKQVRVFKYMDQGSATNSSGTYATFTYFSQPILQANVGYIDMSAGTPFIAVTGIKEYAYDQWQSTSNYAAFSPNGALIKYRYVQESDDDNNANGYTEHSFNATFNGGAQLIFGSDNPFDVHANNAIMDGLETEKNVYKRSGNSYEKIMKEEYQYQSDSRHSSWYDGWLVRRFNNSNYNFQYAPTSNVSNLIGFNISRYPRYSTWVYLKKKIQTSYVGTQAMVNETNYTYNNINSNFPSVISNVLSNNMIKSTEYKYPLDYPLNDPNTPAITALVANNNVGEVLETKSTITTNNATQTLETIKHEFGIFNNKPLLKTTWASKANEALEQRIQYNKYTLTDRISEVNKTNDAVFAYKWGYNNMYPVLQAKNINENEIYYNSFEEDASGIADGFAKSGEKVATNSYTVNFTPPNSKQYVLTYYLWENNKWVFHSQAYGGTSVVITGSKIDEVRLYPSGNNEIVTYTYKPLVGITSETDANGKTTYYEYDAFNRLAIVRDQDLNVLKKICYNYAGQAENCMLPCTNVAANWQNTTTPLRCQQNGCTYTGYQEQEQKDMNSCSPTYNQTRWITGAYNPSACPATTNVAITYSTFNISGFTAVYTNSSTGVSYTFPIPTGSGTLGCVPAGSYTVVVSKPGNISSWYFSTGCQAATGTSVTFKRVTIDAQGSCNLITIGLEP